MTSAPYEDPRLLALFGDSLHPGGVAATQALLAASDIGTGARVLDLACGPGAGLDAIAEHGARGIGVDASPRLAALARARGHAVVTGAVPHVPFAAASFDAVLTECTLCLFGDKDQALASMRDVLVPGGRLLLSDVTLTAPDAALQCVPGAVLCLDGAEAAHAVQARVERAGFTVRHVADRRADVAAWRDRVRAQVDVEGLLEALGSPWAEHAAFVRAVDDAFLEGRLGYVALVAER